MITEIKVPVFAESIPDGTLLEWKKQPGEAVGRNQRSEPLTLGIGAALEIDIRVLTAATTRR